MRKRLIEVYGLNLIRQVNENVFLILAEVSRGTYIRSLAEDIAEVLETKAYVRSLKRTVNGQFHLNESITLDKLREIKDNVGGAFVPIDSVEFNVTTVFVSDGDVSYLKMGTCVSYDFGDEFSDHGVALARSPSGLVVSEIDLGRNVLRPRKVIF